MHTIAVSEADRVEAYTRMQAGSFVLAAIPDFQFKWMERAGIDPKTKRTLKQDVTDPAVLAVLNENTYEWSRGMKPARTPVPVQIGECQAKAYTDAIRALSALGYKQREAKRALDGIPMATAESLVRTALGRLTNTAPQQPVDLEMEADQPLAIPAQAVGYSD